ncbi:MAG: translocation/assembly module TamB domain-containing protein [Salibacteraceae bacterium]
MVDWSANYLSEYVGSEVSVGSIYLVPFTEIHVNEILIRDIYSDTLIYAKTTGVNLNGLSIDSNKVRLGEVILEDGFFNLNIRNGDTISTLTHFINAFPKSSDTNSSADINILAEELSLRNLRFHFNDENAPQQNKNQIDFKHLELDGINGNLERIGVFNDSIVASVTDLRCTEKSGFMIRQLDADMTVSSRVVVAQSLLLESNSGVINGFFAMGSQSWSSYSNFLQEIELEADLVESFIVFNDIAYFTPQVKNLLTPLSFSGHVSGTIDDLSARIDSIGFLNSGGLNGKVNIKGLPEVSDVFIDADINRFYSSLEDAVRINIPTADTLINLDLPDHIMNLQFVDFNGRFTGFINDFVTYGDVNTSMGTVTADINIKTTNGFEYSGDLSTSSFQLGRLIGTTDQVGNISMNLNVVGSGFEPKTMTVLAKGSVAHLELRGYDYTNIGVDGELRKMQFLGSVNIADTNVKLAFDGRVDFNPKIPQIEASCDVARLKLAPLNLVPADSSGDVSGQVKLAMFGNSLQSLHGDIRLFDVAYSNDDFVIGLDSFLLSDSIHSNKEHSIRIVSDILDASVTGKTSLLQLPYAVTTVGNEYMPNYIPKLSSDQIDTNQYFDYNIHVKQANEWIGFFVPELSIDSTLFIQGSLDLPANSFEMASKPIDVAYSKLKFDQFMIHAYSNNDHLDFDINATQFRVSDQVQLDNLKIASYVKSDTLETNVHWNNETTRADSGGIDLTMYRSEKQSWGAVLNAVEMRLAESYWKSVNRATFSTDSNSIRISRFDLVSSEGRIKCDGVMSKERPTELEFLVRSFDLSYLSNFGLLEKDLNGLFRGEVALSYDNGSLFLDGILNIDSLEYDEFDVGNVNGNASYNAKMKRIDIDVDLERKGAKSFTVIGEYYPNKTQEQLDLEVDFREFELRTVEPFVESFVSRVEGGLDGSVSVTGRLNAPVLKGKLQLSEAQAHVNYLNTDYFIPEGIVYVERDMFALNHTKVLDTKGDSAFATAQVFHTGFKELSYDVFVQAENFLGLNTSVADNELYYGTANVTGDINIGGYAGHTIIDVDVSTDPNTEMSIPLSSGGDVSEFDYIRFVDNDGFSVQHEETALNEELNGLELNFKLAVDQDALVQIIFDEKVGDIIKVRGNGDMLMAIDNRGKFNMYGDYVIEKGDYLFTLQNVVNKRFEVTPGSKLTWNGDPLNAQLDLVAVYGLKASPAVMVNAMAGDQGAASQELYNQRLPTNVNLYMTGPMTTPNIEFGVNLPTLPESDIANQLLDPAIASKDQRTSQAFSLLIANQFSAGNGAVALGGAGQSSGYEVLSNQLSNWLSQYSENFDFGVNHRDSYVDETTGEDIAGQTEVSVSTELFNNRVKVEVNGTVQGTAENQEEATNNVAGEFNVEYKINEDGSLRARVFNESNQQSAANLNQAPYTQGIGIFYRKEFDTWGEFFKGLFGKNKK